ncbi:hairy/enhancer-of-split related with YRPW motif protein 2 [Narcine bancroftii]|uniref:hairy/enhancer-of-split related with YRPW motif protein 2 n=1 Tax=Narcine bancroftii TaxID=1343680 RepID=UPI00383167F2
MKRPCEESSSDSDIDETIDVGSENIYAGQDTNVLMRAGSPTTTSQIMARKKRRGIIEKRRRDRINNSLSELRRLVPTAFEKQGSAKLEKAEILQMTVDHLKMLRATGGKGFFDAHALAMDFMSIGFRECLAEVARYLSSVEGLDTSDPLRLRLVSHLNTYASQREAAVMSSSVAHHQRHQQRLQQQQHWAAAFHQLPSALLQHHGIASDRLLATTSSEMQPGTGVKHPRESSALLTATLAAAAAVGAAAAAAQADTSLRAVPIGGAGRMAPLSTSLLSLSATVHAAAHSFPLPFGTLPAAAVLAPGGAGLNPSSFAAGPQTGSGEGNPYRLWSTEIGAF